MNFYTLTVIIAIILLIILLAFIGITMTSAKKQQTFPTTQNVCPDGWIANGAGACIPPSNGFNTGVGFTNERIADIYNQSSICSAKNVAISKKISWDGVSNYNGQC